MMNAHLQKGMKWSSSTHVCMSGSMSEFLNVSTFFPRCPTFLVHISENVPIYLKTIMGILTMTTCAGGLGNHSAAVVLVT
jgi:hypothetical protein